MFPSSRTSFFGRLFPPSALPLYAAFLATGAMDVLLGILLPRVAAAHHLTDSQCGTLLFIHFAASASGALLVRRRFRKTLAIGFALTAAAALVLIAATGVLAAIAVGAFGMGLGMAMTSVSLLMSRLVPDSRGAAMSVLNFVWSVGATVCPLLLARWPASRSMADICAPVAAVAVLFAIAALRGADALSPAAAESSTTRKDARLPLLLLFSAMAFLYVGVECATGSWMTTWAARIGSWSFSRSNLAAVCFWGALLVGRGVTPVVLQFVSELRLHRASVAAAALGIAALVCAHSSAVLLAAACCTGLALAPVFPLTIALFMERAGESANAGWVFACAGYGGAFIPWLTGMVSTSAHSLRAGLLVTLASAIAMLLLTLRLAPHTSWRSSLRRVSAHRPAEDSEAVV